MTISTVRRTNDQIIAQGRLWFRYARILEASLREQGTRLWVKPRLHAQYGLRQSALLGTRTFILTSRLDGGREKVLEDLLQQSWHPHKALRTRQSDGGSLVLFTGEGHRLGRLGRPAWSWIRPLVEIGYEPAFFLREIAMHQGALKAHIVIAHFHEGVETYLMEHYRQRVEAVLA